MQLPTLLKRHQINDQAWNELIDNSVHSVIYAYTWYLDCVSPNWQALIYPSIQNPEIVMPLPIRRKWGVDVIQQPLFCQYLGVFSKAEISEAEMDAFLKSLDQHFFYISVYDFHPGLTPLLQKSNSNRPKFEVNEKTTHWLPVDRSYSDLAGNYKKDRIKNLKKSSRYKWECIRSKDIEPIIALFKENHASKITNVKESAYVLLRKLTKVLLEKETLSIRYASQNEKIHAGLVLLKKNGMAIYIFNAADEIGRRGNARTLLLDQYFRDAAGRLQVFDFESPEVKSIAAFYESFGAERRVYISIKKNKLPFPVRQLQNFRKRFFLRR